MAIVTQEPVRENLTDQYPLLTESVHSNGNNEHLIQIERAGEATSSASSHYDMHHGLSPLDSAERSRSGIQVQDARSPSFPSRESSRDSSLARRNEGLGRNHQWSLLNSGFWILLEFLFTLSQIIASVVVLSLSRHEKPRAPLFPWVVGYTAGCVASLPIIYWRYLHCNQATGQRSSQLNEDTIRGNSALEQSSYITISLGQSSEQDGHVNTPRSTYNGQTTHVPNPRLSLLMDHLKMGLDCFFAVWFVVGNVWIFGGRSSVSDAPNLYRLCIVYLTLSCIGYAMPFILCAMICCCMPCIISLLGIREDRNQIQGASDESIDALPIRKFKLKKSDVGSSAEAKQEGKEGGIVAASGTEKERAISGEDAVCCICLASYVDGDVLREMPCSHLFHAECVDRWLRINASCPLCKCEIGDKDEDPTSPSNSSQGS